ncbi:LIM domain-binding protein 1 isoform X3 [Carlito syrichta]|uniref:LIM domain-binding protein 1 isoform X3 n=1 Tax=Carlito syrichta TaxID=1868482 RepID=A0A3Q0DXB1_CARSF|nr:LIM domain-binding protein 1 isoform X3 [Carlito syrichta]
MWWSALLAQGGVRAEWTRVGGRGSPASEASAGRGASSDTVGPSWLRLPATRAPASEDMGPGVWASQSPHRTSLEPDGEESWSHRPLSCDQAEGRRGQAPPPRPAGFQRTPGGLSRLPSLPGCSSKSFKLYSPKEPPNGNAFPPFHPGTMLDRDVGPTPMYPPTYLEPGIGRHTPYGNQTDYRIFELNKRLQNWTEECDNLWWDAFTTEFFEDDAMLTITFCLEDGPKRYTIGRTLIPRYFRSIFEGGATELYYVLKHPKEAFHSNFVSLDCDQGSMVTQHGKPMFTQVCVEGRLYLEFMFDDMMRIKTWHFSIRQHRELIPRSILAMHAQDPQMLDQLSKNVTRCGLSNSTLNYLRLCVILEPMQELMSRHKTYSLSPRDCLKTCLFQKWQRMVAPPGNGARAAAAQQAAETEDVRGQHHELWGWQRQQQQQQEEEPRQHLRPLQPGT